VGLFSRLELEVVSIRPNPVLVLIRDSLELSLCIVVNGLGTWTGFYYSIFAVAVTGLCCDGYILVEATTLEP